MRRISQLETALQSFYLQPRLIFFSCCALACALPLAARAADYGLVVGIDEYLDDGPPKSSSPDLFACARDAESLAGLLGEMGLAQANIRVLTDAAATKQAMLGGLAWLAASCDSQSTVYFYYSGHGSTGLTDADGDEPDGYDEGLVPTDVINPADYFDAYVNDPQLKARVDATMLYDDELQQALRSIAGRAGRVVVILDTCHSAGAVKGLAGSRVGIKQYDMAIGIDPTGGRPSLAATDSRAGTPALRPPPAPAGGPGSGGAPGPISGPLPGYGQQPPGQPGPPEPSSLDTQGIGDQLFYEGQSSLANMTVLAACEPTQFSQADPELGHGSFTFALLNAVYNDAARADLDGDGRLSWYEVGSYAHFWVSQRSQEKAAAAGDEALLQFPVLYNPEAAQAVFIDAPTVGEGRELIEPVALPAELME